MKYSKRIASIALSAIIAASVATTTMSMGAFAAAAPGTTPSASTPVTENQTVTITFKDTAQHTLNAYKIFDADVSTNGTTTKLAINGWGAGVNGGALYTAFTTTFTGYGTAPTAEATDKEKAQYVADVIGGTIKNSDGTAFSDVKGFAELVKTHKASTATATATSTGDATNTATFTLAPGYYLIDDASTLNEVHASNSSLILEVVGEQVDVTAKADLPSMIKKVKENQSDNLTGVGNTDDNLSGYNIEAGYNDVADYNIGDMVPFQLIGSLPDNFDDYTTYAYKFSDTLGTQFDDPTQDSITVKIGTTTIPAIGSDNHVNYTVGGLDTTAGGTFTIEFTDLKNLKDAEGTAITVNETDYVVVEYTAKLNATAEIGLPGQENKAYLEYSNNPNGEGTGKTPEDKVIVFTYELDITKYADSATEGKELAGAGFVLKTADGKYVKVTGSEGAYTVAGIIEATDDASAKADCEFTTPASGKVSIKGLDEGTYTLIETTVPAGYTSMGDETVTITADTVNAQNWNGTTATLKEGADTTTGNTTNGAVTATVVNKSGSSLPETGGIGTTIFYVVGGTAVVGASILLIAKKRANNK